MLNTFFIEYICFFHHILLWAMSDVCFSLSSTGMFNRIVLKLLTWAEVVLVWPYFTGRTAAVDKMTCWDAVYSILMICIACIFPLKHSKDFLVFISFPYSSCLLSFTLLLLLSLKINHSSDSLLIYYFPLPVSLSLPCLYLSWHFLTSDFSPVFPTSVSYIIKL